MYLKRLKELRTENKLSQQKIAEILNMKQQQYARYENGTTDIPFDTIIELAKYYKVSIDYIAELTNKR